MISGSKPKPGSRVTVHYTGIRKKNQVFLINGTSYDSIKER